MRLSDTITERGKARTEFMYLYGVRCKQGVSVPDGLLGQRHAGVAAWRLCLAQSIACALHTSAQSEGQMSLKRIMGNIVRPGEHMIRRARM